MDLRFDAKDDDVFQQDHKKSHKKAKVEHQLPESASQCTICLDSWQSSGPHKICSLKCGHLFGRSCIEKWLRNNKLCPMCKAKAQRSHIRPLFVQHLIVVDNTEECRLTKLLAEEAGKREKLVRSYKADMERIHLECIAYKQQVDKLKRELDDERTKFNWSHWNVTQAPSPAAYGDADDTERGLDGHDLLGGLSIRTDAGVCALFSLAQPIKAACYQTPASRSGAALSADLTFHAPSYPYFHHFHFRLHSCSYCHSLFIVPSLLSLRSTSASEILIDEPPISIRADRPKELDSRAPLPLATSQIKRKMDTVHKLSVRRSRVLDISCEGHLLASAVTGGSGSSSKWGLVKVSLLDPTHQETIAGLHDKQIRDIKCGVLGSASENLVLTASEDKTLHVVSLRTNSSVQTFTLEAGTWACEWDRNDPNYIYCGVRNAVWVYDMRNSTIALPRPTSAVTQPIHSLGFLPDHQGRKGLLAASCGGVFCFDLLNEWEATKLPLSGVCSSVSYDHESRHCAASFRSSPHYAKQSHNIFTFEEGAKPKELRTLYSTSTQTLLSRSTLFSFVDGDDLALSRRLLLAAGSEASNAVALWDVASGQQIAHQLAPHSSPVMDVRHYGEGGGLFLASLSEQQIFLHNLSAG
ncbi:zinc finger, C3HC4 type (RING finger) domain containing protein [Acanthamoeba castellanii str. Neff]|uniref:RING-type E3 ubiquitin transferase n=1 Tax=Acanthamoeba castellanii (strain ATCC 30010 / Neff) TaxID=1257118 RepID=L8GV33_ACACF|nr:zinc finger, C3HC4 type (RING finger) domain containing protein [Acanthamoeba castellanii str. Neff]ELR16865.1 zinc finger, C3HC4 type (RING finger) domain containing protein [Acanthamoeba castellanii str. Neff]